MRITRKMLLPEPCKVCVMLGMDKEKCTDLSYRRCGIYAEIVCAQWDATCKLIRAHTDKK